MHLIFHCMKYNTKYFYLFFLSSFFLSGCGNIVKCSDSEKMRAQDQNAKPIRHGGSKEHKEKLISASVKLSFLLISFFYGCTAQNFVPVRPLQKGENEVRWSINYSLNDFDFGTYQFAAYHGISDKDVLGLSIVGVLPGSVSYAHYWQKNNYYHNIQVHLNDIFSTGYNPDYEIDYAVTFFNNRTFNSFKMGFGLYTTSILEACFRSYVSKAEIVPVLGYRFQHNELSVDAQLMYGMTEYFINYYEKGYRKFNRDTTLYKVKSVVTSYPHDEIKGINKLNGEYFIALRSNDTLVVSTEDPFSDGLNSLQKFRVNTAYTAENHKLYWIYSGREIFPDLMLELDMEKVIAKYENGGSLDFIEDADLAEQKIKFNYRIWEDLFFSAGRVIYNFENEQK